MINLSDDPKELQKQREHALQKVKDCESRQAIVQSEFEQRLSDIMQERRAYATFVAACDEILRIISPNKNDLDAKFKELAQYVADSQATTNGESNFSAQIIEIIRSAHGRRGIAFDELVKEAKSKGLKTNAATFDLGVRYSLANLKKSKKIRSPKRGWYKAIEAKNDGEATVA